jgi:hypothetical protein
MRDGLFGIDALVREPALVVDRRPRRARALVVRRRHAVTGRTVGVGPVGSRHRLGRAEQDGVEPTAERR